MDNVLEVSLLQCEVKYVIMLTEYSVVSLFIRLRYVKFSRIVLMFWNVCFCVSLGVATGKTLGQRLESFKRCVFFLILNLNVYDLKDE